MNWLYRCQVIWTNYWYCKITSMEEYMFWTQSTTTPLKSSTYPGHDLSRHVCAYLWQEHYRRSLAKSFYFPWDWKNKKECLIKKGMIIAGCIFIEVLHANQKNQRLTPIGVGFWGRTCCFLIEPIKKFLAWWGRFGSANVESSTITDFSIWCAP